MALTWLTLQFILPIPKNLVEQTTAFWKPRLCSERIGALFFTSHVVNWLWPAKKKKTKRSWHTSSSFALWFMENSNVDFKTLAQSQSQINVWAVASFFSCGTLQSRQRPLAEQAALAAFLKKKKSQKAKAADFCSLVSKGHINVLTASKKEKPKSDKLHGLVVGQHENHFAWNLDDLMCQGKARSACWLPFTLKKQNKNYGCSLTDSKCVRHRGRAPLPLHVSLRRVRTSLLHLFKQWAPADWDNICFIARDVICHTGEAGGDESRLVWWRTLCNRTRGIR